jgi:hypothetical protein
MYICELNNNPDFNWSVLTWDGMGVNYWMEECSINWELQLQRVCCLLPQLQR